jgi:hypothetical protein
MRIEFSNEAVMPSKNYQIRGAKEFQAENN